MVESDVLSWKDFHPQIAHPHVCVFSPSTCPAGACHLHPTPSPPPHPLTCSTVLARGQATPTASFPSVTTLYRLIRSAPNRFISDWPIMETPSDGVTYALKWLVFVYLSGRPAVREVIAMSREWASERATDSHNTNTTMCSFVPSPMHYLNLIRDEQYCTSMVRQERLEKWVRAGWHLHGCGCANIQV